MTSLPSANWLRPAAARHYVPLRWCLLLALLGSELVILTVSFDILPLGGADAPWWLQIIARGGAFVRVFVAFSGVNSATTSASDAANSADLEVLIPNAGNSLTLSATGLSGTINDSWTFVQNSPLPADLYWSIASSAAGIVTNLAATGPGGTSLNCGSAVCSVGPSADVNYPAGPYTWNVTGTSSAGGGSYQITIIATPEIDAAAGTGAIGLLLGAMALAGERRRRRAA